MNWKTTSCGVLAIIAAAITFLVIPILDANASTVPQWGAFIAAATAAVGLYFAKDATPTDSAGSK